MDYVKKPAKQQYEKILQQCLHKIKSCAIMFFDIISLVIDYIIVVVLEI
jgi:hypothetical protein